MIHSIALLILVLVGVGATVVVVVAHLMAEGVFGGTVSGERLCVSEWGGG